MKKLYAHTTNDYDSNSSNELVEFIINHVQPKSVIDIGCGRGKWLHDFSQYGISDFMGVDGAYVDKSLLLIPQSKFIEADLAKPFKLQRKFDLVLTLEVAEHLPASSADDFVKSICQLGDNILFSAAVPGQGGQNHINEQDPNYWRIKFESQGFRFYDLIRPKFWERESLFWWYKQNTFFVSKYHQPGIEPLEHINLHIHPGLLGYKEAQIHDWETGNMPGDFYFRLFCKALKRKTKKILRLNLF